MSLDDGDPGAADLLAPSEQLLWALERQSASSDDLVMRGSDEADIEEELVRTHLPLLEEAGYVEWDRESGKVKKGPNFDEIKRLLEEKRE